MVVLGIESVSTAGCVESREVETADDVKLPIEDCGRCFKVNAAAPQNGWQGLPSPAAESKPLDRICRHASPRASADVQPITEHRAQGIDTPFFHGRECIPLFRPPAWNATEGLIPVAIVCPEMEGARCVVSPGKLLPDASSRSLRYSAQSSQLYKRHCIGQRWERQLRQL